MIGFLFLCRLVIHHLIVNLHVEFISIFIIIHLLLYIIVSLQLDLIYQNHFDPSLNANFLIMLLISIFFVWIDLIVILTVIDIYMFLQLLLLNKK